ncbi:metallophosphoesterase [Zophobihabitans entericus]|uniref:Metallophosphoesterase n=1 Tax=Zophobihabitans entericus TaxID=1635327 RepID=A0A6G9IE22_9GAMM|nr:metallophosphoesterase [Zophobihabitans entericus]QIQ22077.1 metallophosphoesterase [Zophobihabitans entericus]
MGLFFVIAVVLSFVIAVYIGCRLLAIFNYSQSGYFSSLPKKIFWVVIILASLSFILTRIFAKPDDYWFPLLSNYIFSFVLCLFFTCILFDIFFVLRYAFTRQRLKPKRKIKMAYLVIAIGMFAIGLHSASSPRTIIYDITIDKPALVKDLRIVQLSDIHVSETTSPESIKELVNKVNSLNADFIFITGDTLDMALFPYLEKGLPAILATLKSTYGTIVIFGNHEHYGTRLVTEKNTLDDITKAFEDSNMLVLRDQVKYYPELGISLIGRDDYVVPQLGRTRLELNDLITQVDTAKPVLLLDHQPRFLPEAARAGVDVMYSGHTHAGQVFPMNLLVEMMYDNAWGQYMIGNHFTSIVSSGYGLWGPPIRLLTQAEIVVTDIHFQQ